MDVSIPPKRKPTALTTCSIQLIRRHELLCLPHEEQPYICFPRYSTTPPNYTPPAPNLPAQTSPVVGISFCLIIVRLGYMTPEARENSWQSSQHSRVVRTFNSRHSRLSVPLDRVKVERDVYVSETGSGVVEFHMIGPTSSHQK